MLRSKRLVVLLVILAISCLVWQVVIPQVQEARALRVAEQTREILEHDWVRASGHLYPNVRLYHGTGLDKEYVGKILDVSSWPRPFITIQPYPGGLPQNWEPSGYLSGDYFVPRVDLPARDPDR
jgi:hypothetical protein